MNYFLKKITFISLLTLLQFPLEALEENFVLVHTPFSNRVVFDIDDVLAVLTEKIFERKDEIYEAFPDSVLVTYQTEEGQGFHHFFCPGYLEVILSIIEWGWGVDFFSSGMAQRNMFVIPSYLKTGLGYYYKNYENKYEKFQKDGQFRIFSRHHMTTLEKSDDLEKYKKSLKGIVKNIDYAILIDDNPKFVKDDELPFVKMDTSGLAYFKKVIKEGGNISDCGKQIHENPAYVLGILSDCKKLMDKEESLTIRKALDQVIRLKNKTEGEAPWMLSPTKDEEKSKAWIAEGSRLIAEMKKKRLPDYKLTLEVYEALKEKHYPHVDTTKGSSGGDIF